MGDWIWIFLAGYSIWWLLSKRKQQSSNDSQMTDTQRRWREYRAIEESKRASDENDNQLEGLDPTTRSALQKLLAMRDYINAHKRPFKFSEWLLWGIDPRFVRRYSTWAILYFGCSFLPLFWGWPVNLVFMMGFWMYLDIMFYKQELVMKVTEWSPEWNEKFGKNNK